jgi:hypothetical protein
MLRELHNRLHRVGHPIVSHLHYLLLRSQYLNRVVGSGNCYRAGHRKSTSIPSSSSILIPWSKIDRLETCPPKETHQYSQSSLLRLPPTLCQCRLNRPVQGVLCILLEMHLRPLRPHLNLPKV